MMISMQAKRPPHELSRRGQLKVHYVRNVTQREDTSRIRMHQLPQIFAIARNFSLNLYCSNELDNVAQVE